MRPEEHALKIIALGGLGEIGMNMMLFESGSTIVIVDAGLMFPEDYMLGVDYVIPDMEYIRENREKVAGIVITHAHEDHTGALPYLLREVNAPVYATSFALGMIRHKLEEHGLLEAASLVKVSPERKLALSPFVFDFIRVNHSVVDGVGFALETPAGLIVHTGDFKLSESVIAGMTTDTEKFAKMGDKGVLALLSDSTNVERQGHTLSDAHVGDTMGRIVAGSGGRVIIALFASNIARIQQVVNILKNSRRKLVFNGKSIELSAYIAKQLGMLHIPEGMEIDISAIDAYPPEELVILTTGSQGEPMSALTRMSAGMHKQIQIAAGDTVVLSSKFIPGNEKAIAKIINNLFRKGADVIYETISDIHVSGHAFREELRAMINMIRPQYFIPIHGEYRHLFHHARLARECGIAEDNVLLAENGQVISFDSTGGRVAGSVPTTRVLVDGKGIGDVGRLVLKERRLLSEKGLVVVILILDEATGFVIHGPDIVSRGFVFEGETGHIIEDAKCVVLEVVDDMVTQQPPDGAAFVKNRLPRELREYFHFTMKRKPVIVPVVLAV